MKSAKEGCLLVFLLRGELERDTDVFSKMDPYVIFKLNDQNARSLVKDEAGKNPEWNETFSFRCKEGDTLFFNVYDKDLKSDDEVGSGHLNVHKDFIDNRTSYLYPVSYKGKSAGNLALQLTFLPDDGEVVKLVQSLQKELEDKRTIVKEIKEDIEQNLKNPPKPKPECLLLKNLLDIFETKKQRDTKFIEESISKVEEPYILKLKELKSKLEELCKINQNVSLKNAESLNYVNEASYELSLYKNLTEKGRVKIKIMELEIVKDKKYDPYILVYLDRQSYKSSVAKNMKKSVNFGDIIEAKRINDDILIVNLMDKTSVGNDDILGIGAIDLMPVILKKDPIVINVALSLNEKSIGSIVLSLHFIKE